MGYNRQERIEGLKIRALPRSCGMQIKGKHFGVNNVPLQKKDKDGKPMFDANKNPIFEQKVYQNADGEIKPLFTVNSDGQAVPVWVTKQVPDEIYVDNDDFIWAIVNKRAVSACEYEIKIDNKGNFKIEKKSEKVA